MSSTMYAQQQAPVAASARPWTALGHGTQLNVSVAMFARSMCFVNDITTMRPARHLGGLPT